MFQRRKVLFLTHTPVMFKPGDEYDGRWSEGKVWRIVAVRAHNKFNPQVWEVVAVVDRKATKERLRHPIGQANES